MGTQEFRLKILISLKIVFVILSKTTQYTFRAIVTITSGKYIVVQPCMSSYIPSTELTIKSNRKILCEVVELTEGELSVSDYKVE